MSNCTMDLVMSAAFLAYTVEHNRVNTSEDITNVYRDKQKALTDAGYNVVQATSQSQKTSLTAVCYGNDKEGPIIIAFRGTASLKDIAADVLLTANGVVGKEYRDEAFAFYNQIKEKYPKREIIITGHSLGGHLAQYVGVKAYATNQDLRDDPSVYVRTFNSATIFSKHGEVLDQDTDLRKNFHNYRLQYDVVSTTPEPSFLSAISNGISNFISNLFFKMTEFTNPTRSRSDSMNSISSTYSNLGDSNSRAMGCYGQMFTFKSKTINSHTLSTFFENLPKGVSQSPVATSSNGSASHNAFTEMLQCSFHAYEVRVSKQVFSGIRQGKKNLEAMQGVETTLLLNLSKDPPDYATAKKLLDGLSDGLSTNVVKGRYSSSLIGELIKEIDNLVAIASITNKPHAPVKSDSTCPTVAGISLHSKSRSLTEGATSHMNPNSDNKLPPPKI